MMLTLEIVNRFVNLFFAIRQRLSYEYENEHRLKINQFTYCIRTQSKTSWSKGAVRATRIVEPRDSEVMKRSAYFYSPKNV